MNERWNLDPIYKGFGDAAFGRDVQALEGAVKELEAFAGNLTGEPLDLLKRGLALQERITELARKLFTFAELRQAFASVDKVGERYVFNIGGNKYRLIATIAYSIQTVWVKHVLTHAEYDEGAWK